MRRTLLKLESSNHEHYHGKICWCDAADPAGLAEVGWANAREFFTRLHPELRNGSVIEMGRNWLRLQSLKPFDLLSLAVNVARVFGFQKHLLYCFGRERS